MKLPGLVCIPFTEAAVNSDVGFVSSRVLLWCAKPRRGFCTGREPRVSRARDVAGAFLWASAQPAVTWLASWLSSWRSQRFVFKRRGGGERAGEAPGISPEAFRSGFAAASC